MSTTPEQTDRFIRLVNSRLKFSLYLLWKLPSAWLAGVRVQEMDAQRCVIRVPYRWLSQNPFRSTYFACLAMAAEMSTGLLSMAYAGPRVSMLVTGMEGIFLKKAVSITWFTCDEGERIKAAIQTALDTGGSSAVTIAVTGKSAEGTEIATFRITWSYKAKN
ncbi:DUF4442 domain-containing protein [Chitinophaga sp. XS-30]|uniref:DUF4442 domain-containing protein n=1 Tax=Chitinophaga sp. XS-30 TaxID=2604421 RepID=UPI0011DE195B|nr:DUF4442 domain-containing protein [Chitinophaga sp. XS-30]QEH39612.1 DUF4442 domain-containing protein [Chitinophaga sp. XS-30]